MPARTLQQVLDNGNPTDVPQALGLLNFGSQLAGLFASQLDTANRTVTADECELVDSDGNPEYGHVQHVHATVGGTTGPCQVILTGAPATGQVLLEDVGVAGGGSKTGQPKLTFAAADAVTACRVAMAKVVVTRNGTAPLAALSRELG